MILPPVQFVQATPKNDFNGRTVKYTKKYFFEGENKMKKLIVIALAVVMVLSVVAFAACGGSQTVEGEYKYANTRNDAEDKGGILDDYYGCHVKVTVKDGLITKVEVTADTDKLFNLSAGWTSDYTPTGEPTEGKKAWMNNGKAMADSFVGLKVEDVKKIVVTCKDSGEPDTSAGVTTIAGAPSTLKVVVGATQSSGRLILAVQNALSKLA